MNLDKVLDKIASLCKDRQEAMRISPDAELHVASNLKELADDFEMKVVVHDEWVDDKWEIRQCQSK